MMNVKNVDVKVVSIPVQSSLKSEVLHGFRHANNIIAHRELYPFERSNNFGHACNRVMVFIRDNPHSTRADILKFVYSNDKVKVELVVRVLNALKKANVIQFNNGWVYCLK